MKTLQHRSDLIESSFEQLYNQSPTMLISIDKEGCILSISDLTVKKFGYSREEIVGKRFFEFLTKASQVYSQEVILPKLYQNGFVEDITYQVIPKHGVLMDVLFTSVAIKDEIGNFIRTNAVLTDVTQKNNVEKELRVSEKRYRSLFNSINDIYYRTNSDEVIIAASPSVEVHYGYKPEELIGMKLDEIVVDKANLKSLEIEIMKKGKVEDWEIEIYKKDGQITIVSANIVSNFDCEGNYMGVTGIARNVTKRVEAERGEKELLKKNKLLFDSSMDSILLFDATTRKIIDANKATQRLLGFSVEELTSKKIKDLKLQGTEEEANARIKTVVEEGRVSFETDLVKKNGGVVSVEGSATLVTIEGKSLIQSFVRDISDKKKDERATKKFNETILGLLNKEMLIYGSRSQVFHEVTSKAAWALEIDRVSIWLFDERREKIVCECLCSPEGITSGKELFKKDYPNYFKAIETSVFLDADNAVTDPRTKEFTKSYLTPLNIKSMLDVGIHFHGEVIGVVCCEQVAQYRNWTSNEKGFAKALADIVTHLLDDEAIRTKNEELNKSTEKYQNLIENSNDAILITDFSTKKIVVANRAAEQMLGYSKLEFYEKGMLDLRPEEEKPRTKKQMKRIWKEGHLIYESVLKPKEGKLVDVEMSTRRVRIGDHSYHQSFIRDITEKKRIANQLLESESRYRSLNNSLGDAVIISDGKGRILSWNKAAEQIFGYVEAEVLGRPIELIIPPKYLEEYSKGFEKFKKGVKKMISKVLEVEALTKKGKLIPVDISLSNWRVDQSHFFSAVIRDITSRKKAQTQIKSSEARLKKSENMAKVGNWEFDLITNKFSCSDELFRIFGQNAQEEISYQELFDLIHPDDLKLSKSNIKKLLKGIKTEISVVRVVVNKELKYVETISEQEFNDNNEIIKLFGTVQDISLRRTLENELHRRNQQLTVMSKIERALLRFKTTNELGHEICKILVNESDYSFVQILQSQKHDFVQLPIGTYSVATPPKEIDRVSSGGKIAGPIAEAYKNMKIVLIEDVGKLEKYKSWKQKMLDHGFHSVVFIPFEHTREIKGLLCVYSSNPRAHTDDELEILERVTNDLAFGLFTLKVQVEKKELSAFNEMLVSSLNVVSYEMNSVKKTVTLGGSCEKVLGYSASDLGRNLDDFNSKIHPNDLSVIRKKIKDMTGSQIDFEFRFIQPNGAYVWQSAINQITKNESNETILSTGIIINIDDKKNIEGNQMRAEIQGRDKERKRIAQEIHDSLGQTLTVASMSLDTIGIDIELKDKAKRSLFTNTKELIDNAITEAREISHNLMPSSLIDFGLIPSLESDIKSINKSSDIRFVFYHHNVPEQISDELKINVYKIIKEGLNNVLKHSQATFSSVQLITHDRWLFVMIEDNGIGFSEEDKKDHQGIGLNSLRNRARSIGGEVFIENSKGVLITIEIPLRAK